MWKKLGIEPTTNQNEIKNAYRMKLLETNPEENPEGFKELRQAYENALNYARNDQSSTSPIDEWMNQVEKIYAHFDLRRDITQWEKLFESDLCYGFDTKGILEDRLLDFLQTHYLIPHEVWVLMNDKLLLLDHIEDLYDRYGEEYINIVVRNGILYEDMLPFQYFEPGIDGNEVEQYLPLYRNITNTDPSERKNLLEQLSSLEESHPYGRLLQLEEYIHEGKVEYINEYPILIEKYPTDLKFKYEYIKSALLSQQFDLAKDQCDLIIESDPNDELAHYLLAQAYGAKHEFKKAIDTINDTMSLVLGDDAKLVNLNALRKEYNVSYIQELLEKEPTQKVYLDLAWAYMQNDENTKAFEVVDLIEPNEQEPFDYYNLMSYVYLEQKKYEESIECTERLIQIIENLQDDGTKKTRKRISRLYEIKNRKADILIQQKQYIEAYNTLQALLEEHPDNVESLKSICIVCMLIKEYEGMYYYADLLTQYTPGNYSAYLNKSIALFNLGNDRDAFEAVNEAISIYQYDIRSYVMRARILLRNGAADAVRDILQLFENNSLQEDMNYNYILGLFSEIEEKDDQKAIECYEKVIANGDDFEYADYNSDLYYRLLTLKGRTLNANNQEDLSYMLDLCEKGLSYDPNHVLLLDYKGWLLVKDHDYQAALPIYQRLEKLETHPIEVEQQLALIYYQEIDDHADLSLSYCLKVLEQVEEPEYIFKAGMCEMYLGKYEEALDHFDLLEKLGWQVDAYYRKSQVYASLANYEQALHYALLAVDEIKDQDHDDSKFFNHVINLYCRMEKFQDAIDFIHNHEHYSSYKDPESGIYRVYLQAGLYEELLKEIKDMKKKGFKEIGTPKQMIDLYYLMGNKRKQEQEINKSLLKADRLESLDIKYRIAITDLQYKQAIELMNEKIELLENEHVDQLSNEYQSLALCYALLGKTELQEEYANKALEYLQQKTAQPYNRYLPLYYSKISVLYALLGRKEEAIAALEKARSLPLCDSCNYCSCKDADLYEADCLYLFGEVEKALEKAEMNRELWKDDYDSDYIIHSLKRKVKK